MSYIHGESLNYVSLVAQKVNDANKLTEMVSDPYEFASQYDLPITETIVSDLGQVQDKRVALNLSGDDPINISMLSFFNKVVIDGRYIHQWVDYPQEVANNLGLTVADSVINRIQEVGISEIIDMSEVVSNQEICHPAIVIILIIVFFWPGEAHVVQRPLIANYTTMQLL
jgi:hypothetical protein